MSQHQPSLLHLEQDAPATAPVAGVAQVLVMTPLAHLDRTFDYEIPHELVQAVSPGVRVKVRFAGTERDGFVVSTDIPTDTRSLAPLRKVVSDLPVLSPQTLALCRAVAARYAGTSTDVIRLAIPGRHAGAEKAALERIAQSEEAPKPSGEQDSTDFTKPWANYAGGPAFIRRLRAGQGPRAVWTAVPQGDQPSSWAQAITAAAGATVAAGKSVVAVLPDLRDVMILSKAMSDAQVDHEVLTADQGASARYRRFVLGLLGHARVIIGTRSAAFAPVRDLGLVVCWDDGDDSLAEQRAPYPHARTVLGLRADASGAGALIGGYVRTPAAAQLVESGWARSLQASRETVRAHAPRVSAPGDPELDADGAAGRARIPSRAWNLLRKALEKGPALVQVPRSGYLPSVSCSRCRAPARCTVCHGRLRLRGSNDVPQCGWCGHLAANFRCPQCEGTGLRAAQVGSNRTAEELGRAFPGVPVQVSGRDGGVVESVDDAPRLVVATPGAEPVADGGYLAAALLDAALLTERPELDAGIEALRRWMRACALVRPTPQGAAIVLGMGAPIITQALVRWDPVGLAQRELAERTQLQFPPVAHMVALTGPRPAVRSMLRIAQLPEHTQVLGPVEVPGGDAQADLVRALVRSHRDQAGAVNAAIVHASALRSAKKEPGSVRVQVDPIQLW